MSVRTKLDEQSDEDEQHRKHECHHQLAKAGLLFLVQSAVFDRHSRRKFHVLHQLILNLANRRTEIASFETSGYTDHLAQVLAFDFRLAFVDVDIGDLIESK